jgi:tetratricopeptide (TPR) repeat protein
MQCAPHFFQGGIDEEILADNLLALGRYQEAESVISSLPPVVRLHTECTTTCEVYRRELLGRAYIGQGKYKEALQVLVLPKIVESSDCADLNLHAGEAFLLLDDKDTAKHMFAEIFYKKEAAVYNQLLELADEDNARAKTIVNEAFSLWQDDHQNGVFELEFCEQIMLQRKCFGAAQIIANRVVGIKQR